MAEDGTSTRLRELLDEKLDSLEKLELVLAVRAANGTSTVVDAARELQIGSDVLRRVAADVVSAGLLEMDGDILTLRPGRHDTELAEAADLYEHHRSQLIRLLSSIAMDKLRSSSARSFADAFRLRKKEGK